MIKPKHLLILAKELCNKPSEPAHRTAISRAYYSLYHEAFQHLATSGHRQTLINEIKQYLTKRDEEAKKKTSYDDEKIEALDPKYLNDIDVSLHFLIPDTFRKIKGDDGRNAFRDFHKTRRKRNNADYRIDSDFDLETTIIELEEIEDIIDKVKKL